MARKKLREVVRPFIPSRVRERKGDATGDCKAGPCQYGEGQPGPNEMLYSTLPRLSKPLVGCDIRLITFAVAIA
jgi:hypothetical protein